VTINFEPDTRAETDRLYVAFAEGGSDLTALQDTHVGRILGLLFRPVRHSVDVQLL